MIGFILLVLWVLFPVVLTWQAWPKIVEWWQGGEPQFANGGSEGGGRHRPYDGSLTVTDLRMRCAGFEMARR